MKTNNTEIDIYIQNYKVDGIIYTKNISADNLYDNIDHHPNLLLEYICISCNVGEFYTPYKNILLGWSDRLRILDIEQTISHTHCILLMIMERIL